MRPVFRLRDWSFAINYSSLPLAAYSVVEPIFRHFLRQ
jgi:hypothetical protein